MTDFHFLANLLFPCSQDNYKGLYAGNITHECSNFGPTMHWRVFYSQTLKATPLNPPPLQHGVFPPKTLLLTVVIIRDTQGTLKI